MALLHLPKGYPTNALNVTDGTQIKKLLRDALTSKINDREMFMKGIDYSYYYEEP